MCSIQGCHNIILISMKIPQSLTEEHKDLHRELSTLINRGGRIGKLAQEVADLLHPHFVIEEKLAMPLLSLLQPLAQDKKITATEKVIAKSNDLEKRLPQMLAEHQRIIKVLKRVEKEAPDFARKLKLHARNEEEVLYPAAILVGKYLSRL